MRFSWLRPRYSIRHLAFAVACLAVAFAWLSNENRKADERLLVRDLLHTHQRHAYSLYGISETGVFLGFDDPLQGGEQSLMGKLTEDVNYEPIRVLDLSRRNSSIDVTGIVRASQPRFHYKGVSLVSSSDLLVELGQFECAEEVHVLIVCFSDLYDDSIVSFDAFPSLRYVDLTRTFISHDGIQDLTHHPTLEHVVVSRETMSNQEARDLLSTSHLKTITFVSNFFTNPYEQIRQSTFEIVRRDDESP